MVTPPSAPPSSTSRRDKCRERSRWHRSKGNLKRHPRPGRQARQTNRRDILLSSRANRSNWVFVAGNLLNVEGKNAATPPDSALSPPAAGSRPFPSGPPAPSTDAADPPRASTDKTDTNKTAIDNAALPQTSDRARREDDDERPAPPRPCTDSVADSSEAREPRASRAACRTLDDERRGPSRSPRSIWSQSHQGPRVPARSTRGPCSTPSSFCRKPSRGTACWALCGLAFRARKPAPLCPRCTPADRRAQWRPCRAHCRSLPENWAAEQLPRSTRSRGCLVDPNDANARQAGGRCTPRRVGDSHRDRHRPPD